LTGFVLFALAAAVWALYAIVCGVFVEAWETCFACFLVFAELAAEDAWVAGVLG
jgi:hypothetical protein